MLMWIDDRPKPQRRPADERGPTVGQLVLIGLAVVAMFAGIGYAAAGLILMWWPLP